MMSHEITSIVGSKKSRRRLGRGCGSGLGKTSGKGHKGQRSRAGKNPPITSEGGQMPLFRRIPKRGFNNANFTIRYSIINVSQLELFKDGDRVDAQALSDVGLIKSATERIKILGTGDLARKLTVVAHKFSGTASEKITAAGGTVEKFKAKKSA